jgi:hypothetical protein
MKDTDVVFRCGKLSLEGVLSIPDGSGIFPAVIVCHPHPLYGGSIDNNVVFSLCQALTQASFISFRFNFRGVGRSEGDFGHGISEQEDVESAVSFVTTVKQVDSSRIGVAGYSAGAVFALPVGVRDRRIKALAAISPPFSMSDFQFLKVCPKPKLLISGSADAFVPESQFTELYRNLAEPKDYDIIEGADHSWWGYELSLVKKITSFFTTALRR